MKMYRIESSGIFFGDEVRYELVTREYKVIKHTKCGFRIDLGCGHTRFISNNSVKKWACTTEEDALVSFLARKKRQKQILSNQLKMVNSLILLAEHKL